MKRFDRIVYFFLALTLPVACSVQCIAGDGTCRELDSVIESRSGDQCLAEPALLEPALLEGGVL